VRETEERLKERTLFLNFQRERERGKMSLFTKIFGSKQGKSQTPSPQEAIQKLHEVEDLLMKRQEVLEKKIEDELKVARTNGVKNKRCKTATTTTTPIFS
jgi:hypothetical protein